MGLQGYVGSSQDQTRIRRQEKEREEQKRKIEELKKETEAKVISAGLRRFGTGTAEVLETVFKNETVGLVTREEFLKKKNTIEERLEAKAKDNEEGNKKSKRKERQSKKQIRAVLSFDDDDEEEEEEMAPDRKIPKQKETDRKERLSKYGKCPSVETDFLPDADRERREKEMREELKQEWLARQEAIKAEEVAVVYSYWDGTGHRRSTRIAKGSNIGDFLRKAREQLSKDFREIRMTSVENLLFIKEDVILPHHYTFYDLIISKARGKSGPLFNFDAHEDIRLVNDATIEKEDSHAAKVIERHWYDKNKHIFPASRWEVYDPDKAYDPIHLIMLDVTTVRRAQVATKPTN